MGRSKLVQGLIMLIYFNGDSNTAGTELEDPAVQGFAGKLAKKLGASKIINHAIPGASNDKILRTTEAYLRDCANEKQYPDLIVIGWSEPGRVDWYYNGEYNSLNRLDVMISQNVKTDVNRYNYWQMYQGHNFDYNYQMCKYYNTRIHNLHLELTDLNIPHVFFNALVSLTNNTDKNKMMLSPQHGPFWELDWNDCYRWPYDGGHAMCDYAIKGGHTELTPGQRHYGELFQEEWAQILFDYIGQKKII